MAKKIVPFSQGQMRAAKGVSYRTQAEAVAKARALAKKTGRNVILIQGRGDGWAVKQVGHAKKTGRVIYRSTYQEAVRAPKPWPKPPRPKPRPKR